MTNCAGPLSDISFDLENCNTGKCLEYCMIQEVGNVMLKYGLVLSGGWGVCYRKWET